ncbi:MAG TPA: hypothetical protein VJY34_02980 [Roseiarcus sp.]|nr:hypothetical protein [Roseiarcus sp.]
MKSTFAKGAAGEPTIEVATAEAAHAKSAAGEPTTEVATAEVTAASAAHVNSAAKTPAAGKG